MVRVVFASVSNLPTKIFSKKWKEATYRVVVAVSLLTLPATAIVSLIIGPKVPRSGRTFVKPATIFIQVPMIVDLPAISDPTFLTAAAAELNNDDLVIGVVAFGEAKAYLKSAFGKGLTSHVVLDRFGATPVTITHCDLTSCTRVFSSTKENSLSDIHCGGWMAEQELALLVGNKRFAQSSNEIPFDDVPFVITTWDKWRVEHPHSPVYLGTHNAIHGKGQSE